MIRLDWDKISYSVAIKRLEHIKKNTHIRKIELRESPSGNGYHVYLTPFSFLHYSIVWRLRRLWKDDGNRLVKDVMNKKAKFRDVMFESKRDGKTGLVMNETPMLKFSRKYGKSW